MSQVKMQLHLEGLPPAWSAFIHKGKGNRVFFINRETKMSIWDNEFLSQYKHHMNEMNLETLQIHANKQLAENQIPTSVDDDVGEPMETDEIAKEISLYRSNFAEYRESNDNKNDVDDGWGNISRALDEVYTDVSALAVFDTSALLNCTGLIKSSLDNHALCVIPHVVLRELDGLKKSSNMGLRDRAFAVTASLHKLLTKHPGSIEIESSIEADKDLYLPNIYGTLQLFITKNSDDRIVKSALDARMRADELGGHLAAERVILVTNDRIMDMKASSFGLQCESSHSFLQHISSGDDPKKSSPSRAFSEERLSNHRKNKETNIRDDSQKMKMRRSSRWDPAPPTHPKRQLEQMKATSNEATPDSATSRKTSTNKAFLNKTSSHKTTPKPRSTSQGAAASLDLSSEAAFCMQPALHPTDWQFPNETAKLLFMMKSSVGVAIQTMTAKSPGHESKTSVINKLAAWCNRFLNDGYEQADFITTVGLIENLYCTSVQLLSASQRVARVKLMEEVTKSGVDCECVHAFRDFIQFITSIGWDPSLNYI